ncbi:MAG: DegT/DnrJ/EryC1/StrS family aminotransferase [Proteobacteria bacterium]|nr:DegT/DnrJ/EryC1/StrS family aminotransferase [Pseudomonadota bacterium]MBU1688679.1 DegT/DnrJ/EryC1/StrS family aminotransferase [Pseudomonadota bacterium]
MIKFLDLQKQYFTIKDEIDEAIQAVISRSSFVGGKDVAQFEEQFARYQQASYCIGVGNGTDAIEIALEALSLPPGSEILVPANTFIATSEAVTRTGHRVVFCDCDPRTYTISPEDVKKRITPQTAAIIAVHLYGHPCDMEALNQLSQEYNLRIIEDCAQAHGAEYKGRRVGAIGDIGTFSFYPGKNLGAFGDGGAIVTNNLDLAKRCRMIANHGRVEKYHHEFEGRNSRLDGIQAAILTVKLGHLDSWLELRDSIARQYLAKLTHLPDLILPYQADWAKHVWHLFVVRCGRRDQLQNFLKENGIQTGIHYPVVLPKQKAYDYLTQTGECVIAGSYDTQILSLPIGDHLEAVEISKVICEVCNFFKN